VCLGSVLVVAVAEYAERLERRPSRLQVEHARDHVDDRLRGQAGYRRRPDVMDTAIQPRPECWFEHGPFSFEETGPFRVVWHHQRGSRPHSSSIDRSGPLQGARIQAEGPGD